MVTWNTFLLNDDLYNEKYKKQIPILEISLCLIGFVSFVICVKIRKYTERRKVKRSYSQNIPICFVQLIVDRHM